MLLPDVPTSFPLPNSLFQLPNWKYLYGFNSYTNPAYTSKCKCPLSIFHEALLSKRSLKREYLKDNITLLIF